MKSVKTLVVVSDGGRAQLWVNEGPGKGIKKLEAMEHPLKSTHELGSSAPGRVQDRFGNRHAVEPHADLHEKEKDVFAKEVAGNMEEKIKAGAYARTLLVAPAPMSERIRAHLSKTAQQSIMAEVHKDLTQMDEKALQAQLSAVIAL